MSEPSNLFKAISYRLSTADLLLRDLLEEVDEYLGDEGCTYREEGRAYRLARKRGTARTPIDTRSDITIRLTPGMVDRLLLSVGMALRENAKRGIRHSGIRQSVTAPGHVLGKMKEEATPCPECGEPKGSHFGAEDREEAAAEGTGCLSYRIDGTANPPRVKCSRLYSIDRSGAVVAEGSIR